MPESQALSVFAALAARLPVATSLTVALSCVGAQATPFGPSCLSAQLALPQLSACGTPFAEHPIRIAFDLNGGPASNMQFAYFMFSFQNQTFAGQSLPLVLSNYGSPCQLLVPPDFGVAVGIDAVGQAHFMLPPLPNSTTVYAQAGVIFGQTTPIDGMTHGLEVSVVPSSSVTLGTCDGFALPIEPVDIGANLSQWQGRFLPGYSLADFDTPSVDHDFLCTIPTPPGSGAATTRMELRLHLRAIGNGSLNDTISVSLQDPTVSTGFAWQAPISSLEGANGTWDAGQTLHVCLDLANLSGAPNVLTAAIAAGELDLRINDDTVVDCVTLVAN